MYLKGLSLFPFQSQQDEEIEADSESTEPVETELTEFYPEVEEEEDFVPHGYDNNVAAQRPLIMYDGQLPYFVNRFITSSYFNLPQLQAF